MPKLALVTDQLSDAAKQLLADGAAAGRTAEFVVQAIADVTGEVVAERTASRRMRELREQAAARQGARERMADLVAAVKAGNGSAAEYIQALAMQALEQEPDGFTESDPVKVQRLALRGEELRIKRDELALKQRAIAVDEKRLQMMQEKEERLKAALTDTGAEAITPEQRVLKVREIMGLTGQVSA